MSAQYRSYHSVLKLQFADDKMQAISFLFQVHPDNNIHSRLYLPLFVEPFLN